MESPINKTMNCHIFVPIKKLAPNFYFHLPVADDVIWNPIYKKEDGGSLSFSFFSL
jgi:hypothetical protein